MIFCESMKLVQVLLSSDNNKITMKQYKLPGWWLTYPSEKYEFVSWDDEIPNIWTKLTCSKPPTRYKLHWDKSWPTWTNLPFWVLPRQRSQVLATLLAVLHGYPKALHVDDAARLIFQLQLLLLPATWSGEDVLFSYMGPRWIIIYIYIYTNG